MPQKCPQCQNVIPAGSEICQHCGYKPKLVERQVYKTMDTSGTNILKFIFIGAFVIALIGIVVTFLVEGNITVTVVNPDKSTIEFNCLQSSDCVLPMGYAVRSNCPYQIHCADYQCVVACPMLMAVDQEHQKIMSCEFDNQCDCSLWDVENKYECKCLDKQCAAVVERLIKN